MDCDDMASRIKRALEACDADVRSSVRVAMIREILSGGDEYEGVWGGQGAVLEP